MKPCPRCGSLDPGPMIGIFFLENRVPHHAAFNCACGDTRGIGWAEATEAQRLEAIFAETARMAMEGWG